jgi:hypothetical protein
MAPPTLSRFATVSTATEQLVMSALQKDPNLRPRDAFTFASALRDLKKQLAGGGGGGVIVSGTQAKTVEQVVAQPVSAARPATPFGHTNNVQSAELLPPSSGPTRIDAPAGMHAATAAASPLAGRTQTLSLGVNPLGLQPPMQETYAAAPLQVTAGEAPIPLMQPIDRRAETREAAPQMAQRPNYDTAPIPLAVMARPESVSHNNGTFGPHTTEASQRKKSARSAMLALVSACAVGALAAVALLVAWKMHHATATTATTAMTATATQTSAPPPTMTTAETAPLATATTAAAATVTEAPSTASTTATPTATAAPTHVHTAAPTQTQTATLTPPTSTQTHAPPPATTTAPTATHHRVGSGL